MKKIKIEGTAFSAVPFAAQNKNKHTLQAEQISIENNEDFVYKFADNQNADENKIVVFDDAKSGKKVAVKLNDKTIEKLKKYFGEEDVYAREDGMVRLNNKAEAFVSGWFGDIAYNREVLGADKDKDGKINEEEYRQTKSFFGGYVSIEVSKKSGKVVSMEDVITSSYKGGVTLASGDYVQSFKTEYTNIDTVLQDTINTDKNFDGTETLEEILKFTYKTDNTMLAVANDVSDMFGISLDTVLNGSLDGLISSKIKKRNNDEEEQKKKLEAIQKLIAAGGDISVLSPEEKELLRYELAKYKRKDSESYDVNDLNKLSDELKNMQTYKENADSSNETVGTYYKDRG